MWTVFAPDQLASSTLHYKGSSYLKKTVVTSILAESAAFRVLVTSCEYTRLQH